MVAQPGLRMAILGHKRQFKKEFKKVDDLKEDDYTVVAVDQTRKAVATYLTQRVTP